MCMSTTYTTYISYIYKIYFLSMAHVISNKEAHHSGSAADKNNIFMIDIILHGYTRRRDYGSKQ